MTERELKQKAIKEIARYNKDIISKRQLRDEIMERYKGALAGQPIGHGSGDNRTGDPERRALQIEELEKFSPIATRLKRVSSAFADLFTILDKRKWQEYELFNLMDGIIDHCDNRAINNFAYISRKYKLICCSRSFTTYKSFIVDKVSESILEQENDQTFAV